MVLLQMEIRGASGLQGGHLAESLSAIPIVTLNPLKHTR